MSSKLIGKHPVKNSMSTHFFPSHNKFVFVCVFPSAPNRLSSIPGHLAQPVLRSRLRQYELPPVFTISALNLIPYHQNPVRAFSRAIRIPFSIRPITILFAPHLVLSKFCLAHLVQGKGEVCIELLETGRNVPTFLASVYAGYEKVDKPRQTVLVHGLDVGEI